MRLSAVLSAILDVVLPRDPRREAARHATADDFAARLVGAERNGVRSYLPFGDPLVRAAVHELKYRNHAAIARVLAEAVCDEIIADLGERAAVGGEPIPIIPVPLSARRLRERGMNQSELIARALAERAGGAFAVRTDIVERARHGESQTSLPDASARSKNVRGAFIVPRPERLPRGPIVVLDDVATTGSTLTDVERALRDAGARDVTLVAIAH